ncbi:hypothetical protein N0X72_07100 [Streptomyces carpaticus]|uniref:SPOR domain-containing protein n=2 Tax=Streptomyces TaxID=1883 RepID=A0A1I6RRH5_9ACTN|nr:MULTISPECIES: hypothetical protein [Streptomyces]MCK1814069.1 hypothetical protein [Streptomyces sp. XM4011]QKV68491.1 hypothetical protein HUT13_06605 [Streptomyces harbinensis]UWM48810.1 hypothetical protein N0X72_07100 [Streptomyces carpaticus]SFS67295.1 hypothetical protein SAMN05444716_103313 [Streptomyces harbinensis]
MAALFRRRMPTGKAGEWYYCLKHQKVEEGPECPAKDRLGPYATREEAARAIETARERDEDWRSDPRWRDREPEPPEGDDTDASPS